MTNPVETPGGPGSPIERKVSVATGATYLGTLAVLAVLNGVADTNLISQIPDWAEVIFAPLIPSLITFLGGYAAPHTPR